MTGPSTEIRKMNSIHIVRPMLFAMAGLALVSGCSSTGPSNGASASAASVRESGNGFVPPFRGETRDQVIAQYDEPDRGFQASQTVETWAYLLDKATQLIPFYGPESGARTR